MDTDAVLHDGHTTMMATLESLPNWAWEESGVCGVWSVREIVAHLASYEKILIEVLSSFLRQTPTLLRERFIADPVQFNRNEVVGMRDLTPPAVFDEYCTAHARAMELLAFIPVEMRQQRGTLPWYGNEYSLDDFVVYIFYGHKREHSAQISVFLDRIAQGEIHQSATETAVSGDS